MSKPQVTDVDRGQLERAIIRKLNADHYGQQNAIKGHELRAWLRDGSFKWLPKNDTRTIRDVIEGIRVAGVHPICSDAYHGYWYAANVAEAELFASGQYSRADKMRRAAEGVKKAARAKYGQQVAGQPTLFQEAG